MANYTIQNILESAKQTVTDTLAHPVPSRLITKVISKLLHGQELDKESSCSDTDSNISQDNTSLEPVNQPHDPQKEASTRSPPSEMSTPSLVGSDLITPIQTTILERDQAAVAEKLRAALETEIRKPYRGFSTEPPSTKDQKDRSPSPEYRRQRNKSEEELWVQKMTEWKSKIERSPGPNRLIITSLSTEDAMQPRGSLLTKPEGMKPTLKPTAEPGCGPLPMTLKKGSLR